MGVGQTLMQMRVRAIEEGIAGANHRNVPAGIEPGGEHRGARIVEGDKRVAIAGIGLGQLRGEGIIEADELGVRIELAVDDAPRVADAPLLGEIGDDRRRFENARRLERHELGVTGADADAVKCAARAHHSASLASALTAATAMALPPLRPLTMRNGVPPWRARASLDSAAPTKPTGMPMIAAGFGAP